MKLKLGVESKSGARRYVVMWPICRPCSKDSGGLKVQCTALHN
jgi:hypothetical protein